MSDTNPLDDIPLPPLPGLSPSSVQPLTNQRPQERPANPLDAIPLPPLGMPPAQAVTQQPALTVSPPAPQQPADGSEFMKGLAAGVDNLQASGYGLAALIGDAFGLDGVKSWGIEGFQRNEEEAGRNQASVPRIEDVRGDHFFGDLTNYAAYGLGQSVPSIASSIAGGGIGGMVVRKGAMHAGKKLAGEALNKAVARGAMTGAAAASVGMESGGLYGKIHKETGQEQPGVAAVFGTLAGLVDSLPVGRILRSAGVGEEAVKEIARRAMPEIMGTAASEAGTEAIQTVIERAAVNWVDENKEIFTPQGWSEILNAGLLGGITGGAVQGAVTGARKAMVGGDGGDVPDDQSLQENPPPAVPQTQSQEPSLVAEEGQPKAAATPHPLDSELGRFGLSTASYQMDDGTGYWVVNTQSGATKETLDAAGGHFDKTLNTWIFLDDPRQRIVNAIAASGLTPEQALPKRFDDEGNILGANGNPFASKLAAMRAARERKDLQGLPLQPVELQAGGGWGLRGLSDEELQAQKDEEQKKVALKREQEQLRKEEEAQRAAEMARAKMDPLGTVRNYAQNTSGRLRPNAISKKTGLNVKEAEAALETLAARGMIRKTLKGYSRVPKLEGPVDLRRAIIERGGIKDEGGELTNAGLNRVKIPFKGSLVSPGGLSLDGALEFATQEGFNYLPPGASHDDLIEALQRDDGVYIPGEADDLLADQEWEAEETERHERIGGHKKAVRDELRKRGITGFSDDNMMVAATMVADGYTPQEAVNSLLLGAHPDALPVGARQVGAKQDEEIPPFDPPAELGGDENLPEQDFHLADEQTFALQDLFAKAFDIDPGQAETAMESLADDRVVAARLAEIIRQGKRQSAVDPQESAASEAVDEVILRGDGKPYVSQRLASTAANNREDLKGRTLKPVQVEGGWGLRDAVMADDKAPSPTKKQPWSNSPIFQKIREEMIAAGRPEEESEAAAVVPWAFFETMGKRAGISPQALFRRWGLKVQQAQQKPARAEEEYFQQIDAFQEDAANFRKAVDETLAGSGVETEEVTVMRQTPPVYLALGMDDLPVHINRSTIRKILAGKHQGEIAPDMLKALPARMADPVMVFESVSPNAMPDDKVILLNLRSKQGKPVMAALHVRRDAGRRQHVIHQVASVYEKKQPIQFVDWMEDGHLLYRDKKTAQRWAQSFGVQFPKEAIIKGRNPSLIEKADVVKQNGGMFYQAGEERRGSIRFEEKPSGNRDGSTLISLFETANPSTFLHESAHLFLEVMADLATMSSPPAGIVRDAGIVLDWLGVKGFDEITAGHHERFARAFETWLAEGRAPVPGLRGVFETIRAWLIDVYRSATAMGVEINDDLRGVFARMVDGGKIEPVSREEVPSDVSSGLRNLESHRKTGEPAHPVGETPVPPAPRGDDGGTGGGNRKTQTAGDDGSRAGSLPDHGAPAVGEQGHSELRDGSSGDDGRLSRRDERGRSGDDRQPGPADERIGEETVARAAPGRTGLSDRKGAQQKADAIAVVPGDIGNIRDTLPLLLPEQQEDVGKAEARFAKKDGHGFLFTNGTGTGKTYSGAGIVKRFLRQGKRDVLIVAPNDDIIKGWLAAGQDLVMEITPLKNTTDAGVGVVVTTYANLGQNRHLADREWDLVVADESHNLMQSESGEETSALRTLRAITNHPQRLFSKANMILRDLVDEIGRLEEEAKHLRGSDSQEENYKAAPVEKRLEALREEHRRKAHTLEQEMASKPRSQVVFLSATPFAYVKTVDYADGYLFDYDEGKKKDEFRGYNVGSNQDQFFVEHFGFRMRTGKLTSPEKEVNSEVMERRFHEWLKERGTLSGRRLEVDADYDRKFNLVDDAVGNRIDQALDFLMTADNGKFRRLQELVTKRFDYLARMRLLEAIKAHHAIPIIKEHQRLGRKVVVFHDYNEGGGFNPFAFSDADRMEVTVRSPDGAEIKMELRSLYNEFVRRNPYVRRLDFSTMHSPIVTLTRAFPGALVYNGTVSGKKRAEARNAFNEDGGGHDLIIIQSAAGQAGISLHDTTGKHQRVMINLGMPVRPTAAIQQEGRIYRTGQVSNAIFRYMNTGTNWERWTFAGKIAERAGTAENLALGEQARAIKQSFIDAFMDSDVHPPTIEDGKGGKEADRAEASRISPFERAKSFYFAQQKKSGRRDQREGEDYYATPEPVGLKMVGFAGLRTGEKALEPSAGHGAIARFLPETTNRTLVEPSGSLASRAAMASPGARVVEDRFENLHIANKFDAVIMNPPYGHGGKTAIEHLAKAAGHLRNGGRIVALLPDGGLATTRYDQFMDGDDAKGLYEVAEIKLPAVTFKRAGTSVLTRIVVLEKQTDKEVSANLQHTRRDYRDAETINDLFDRIEQAEIPQRLEPVTREVIADEDGKVTAGGIEFQLGRQSLKPVTRIGDRFRDVARLAEKHRGAYLKPDFVFPTVEERQSFLADLENGLENDEESSAEPSTSPPGKDAQAKEGGLFTTAETTHARKGIPLFVASLAKRVERDEYDRFNAIAKRHGGYYSSFSRNGAVPGFQFTSTQDRDGFLREVAGHQEERGEEIRFSSFSVQDKKKPDNPISLKELEEAWRAFDEEFKLSERGLDVRLVNHEDEIQWKDPGGTSHFQGAYFPRRGAFIFVASSLRNVAEARNTFRHEVLAHFGLNLFPPADKRRILNEIIAARQDGTVAKVWRSVEEDALYSSLPELYQAEEVFGRLAEEKPGLLVKIVDFLVGLIQKTGIIRETPPIVMMRGYLRAIAEGIRRGDPQLTFPKTNQDQFSTPTKPAPRGGFFDGLAAHVKKTGKGNPSAAREWIDDKLTDARPHVLGAFGGRQIAEMYGNLFVNDQGDSMVQAYAQEVQVMTSTATHMMSQADDLASQWLKLGTKEERALGELMNGATFHGLFPERADSLPLANARAAESTRRARHASISHAEAVRKGENSDLVKQKQAKRDAMMARAEGSRARAAEAQHLSNLYNGLSQEGKKVFIDVRKAFKSHLKRMQDALIGLADQDESLSPNTKQARHKAIRAAFEKALNEEDGPYYPLHRFGGYSVWLAKEGEEPEFHLFENRGDQRNFVNSVRDSRDGWTIREGKVSDYRAQHERMSARFMGDLFNILDKTVGAADLTTALKDHIYQSYLGGMPGVATQKRFIHRRNRLGYSGDALRGFAKSMFHSAKHISRLEHSPRMEKFLAEMERMIKEGNTADPNAARDVLDELKKRHDLTMNPPGSSLTNLAGSAGFVWYLGLSPAAALVNLSQTPLMAFPMMAAKWGWKQSASALSSATKLYAKNKGDLTQEAALNGDEAAAMTRMVEEGVIDLTQAYDLAGLGDNPASRDMNVRWQKVMRVVGWMFHKAEVANRQVTFLAAYRLARSNGLDHESAIKEGRDLTYRGHFDYSTDNRPRYMRGNVARVLLMFKQYSQNIIYTLGRSAQQALEGTDPETRRIARRQLSGILIMHGAAAGALGLPVLGSIAGVIEILHGIFDDDDEPLDVEAEFRNFLADHIGVQAGEIVSKGIPRLLFPGDIAGRVGLNDLLYRDPGREMEGHELFSHWMEQIGGPVPGIAASFFEATKMAADGHINRAWEKLLPKAFRDVFKALRYSDEGANNYRGEPYLEEDLSAGEVIGQMIGFTPGRLSEQWEANRAVKKVQTVMSLRRQRLINRFAMADHDKEDQDEVLQEIKAFNRKNPQLAITRLSLTNSLRSRARASKETHHGVRLQSRHSGAVTRGRFASI